MKKREEKELIDIYEIYKILLKNYKIILLSTLFFFIIGIIYSLSVNNLYKSYSTFYPHYEKASNNLTNIANLAGFNLETESNNIPTNLYPMLIKSNPFKKKILQEKIILDNTEISYREYLLNKKENNSILSFFNHIKKNIFNSFDNKNNPEKENKVKNPSFLTLSEEDYGLHNLLDNLISINLNNNDGFIQINVIDENAYVSSQIAKKSEEILQENIINFKIKNLKETYDYTISSLEIAKSKLFKLQDSLASFRDSNKNIKSDLFKNQLNRIETEYNISKNTYNEIAISKEKISLELRKNTPIFTIIDPVVLPNEKFYPSRRIISIGFSLFGLISSSIFLILKIYIFKKNKLLGFRF